MHPTYNFGDSCVGCIPSSKRERRPFPLDHSSDSTSADGTTMVSEWDASEAIEHMDLDLISGVAKHRISGVAKHRISQ